MFHAHTLDARRVADDLVEHLVPKDAHVAAVIGLGEQAVDQDRLGTELVAAVNHGDPPGNVGQVQRFLDRGVTAADDRDILTLVEKPVAGRARGHALAHERLLGRKAQVPRRGPRGDDQRVARVFAGVADQAQRPLVELCGMDLVEDDFGFEALGVLLEARHELRPLNAVGIGRPVVDIGGRHELATLRKTGDEHRFQVGACSVYCRGEPRRTGAQDQQAGVSGGHGERSRLSSRRKAVRF